jgi:S-adenosylmethionine hydrolase
MRIITLTTDFGQSDWFVGTMKEVIASINPQAKVIDISHGIPAGDIRAGAFALMAVYHYFPVQTIHVAVVDPGVGSSRKGVVIETARYVFGKS